jgi:cephalosporin-C deacetylase
MTHKLYITVLLAVVLGACGCEKKTTDEPQQQQEPEQVEPVMDNPDMSLVSQSVPVTDNWVWSGKPQITIAITNGNPGAVKVGMKAVITTDKKAEVVTLTDSVVVGAKGEKRFVLTTTDKMEPGIYHAECFVNTTKVRAFNFAIDPFAITSVNDKPADFDAFWQSAKDQLAAIEMNAQLTEIPERSNANCKVYLVKMNSVPDGTSGEPVVIRGYYCEPQDGQKHPVILHFYGYDTQGYTGEVACPWGGDKAEFYLSHRGQYLNNRPAGTNLGVPEATENIYGDWFRYNLGERDTYYYRGAYMDVVQAIRFMATRESSDMTKLFAEGSSQGGALTYVAAALSDWPFTAIAANVAFMGDFADAKDIESLAYWEISDHYWVDGVPQEKSLQYLPYFDIKHMTPRISCAVLGSSGLADDVCPARLNLVPFNNLATPADQKEYIIDPEMGHSYPAGWERRKNELFNKYY